MTAGLRDYQTYLQLDRQVRALEQGQERRAGSIQTDVYAFKLSPTCPPSTSILFRGGLAWRPIYASDPAGFYIPSYTVDITDPAKASVRVNAVGYTYTFTNAYWYAPCIVVLCGSLWPPPAPPDTWPDVVPDDAIRLLGITASPYLEEFETATEAENACQEISGELAAYYGIAAGGMILRNNGNTTLENQYLAIDPLNRGRSYLFGRKRYGWELG